MTQVLGMAGSRAHPHQTTKCMNLISPCRPVFAALRYFIERPVYRVMLPKMPKSSKYVPSCIVADRDHK